MTRQTELKEERAKWLAEMRAYEAKVQELEDLEAAAAVAAKLAVAERRKDQPQGKKRKEDASEVDDAYYDEVLKYLFPL